MFKIFKNGEPTGLYTHETKEKAMQIIHLMLIRGECHPIQLMEGEAILEVIKNLNTFEYNIWEIKKCN